MEESRAVFLFLTTWLPRRQLARQPWPAPPRPPLFLPVSSWLWLTNQGSTGGFSHHAWPRAQDHAQSWTHCSRGRRALTREVRTGAEEYEARKKVVEEKRLSQPAVKTNLSNPTQRPGYWGRHIFIITLYALSYLQSKTKCRPNLTPKRLVSGLGLIEECVEAYNVCSGLNPEETSFTNHYVMNFLTVPKNHTIEVHHV